MTMVVPPPSRIYLLRHAKSGWTQPGQHDFDRTLDDEGIAQAEMIARKTADLDCRPDVVISSTAVRCRQTAAAIHRAIGEPIETVYANELYNASLDIYLAILNGQKQARAVMLIGHNPTMEELLEALVGTDAMIGAIPRGYPPAGLAILDHRARSTSHGAAWALTDFLTV